MSQRFAGRVALVTGAGQGIGAATAAELARGGAELIVNDVDDTKLQVSAETLRGFGAKVSAHAGSVTDPDFVTSMTDAAMRDHGRVDLLLNNVGGGPPMTPWNTLAESDLKHFRAIYEVNFFSQVMVLRALLPSMIERGYGKVVCISSMSAPMGQESGSAYSSAKMALHALVSSVSKETASKGVNINAAILGNPPHWTRTPDRQAYLDRLSHIGRVGRLEEFGKALAFLLSDDASYITGASIPIDGGITTPRMNE